METSILSALGFLEILDFGLIFNILAIGFMVFWLVVIGWVWTDASERFDSYFRVILSVVFVVVFNVFGLLIYLIVRPRMTREDIYWSDLERRFLKYEAAGLEDCPKCGYETQPSYINCPNCGYGLRVMCKACDVYLEPGWKYCPFCGARQKATELAGQAKTDQNKKRGRKRLKGKFILKSANIRRFLVNVIGKKRGRKSVVKVSDDKTGVAVEVKSDKKNSTGKSGVKTIKKPVSKVKTKK
ncbi:MAG: zinc ribbon domain-containing protein [Patescibacteria group bacterium]|nr:zinc ribbon domain-containing protein [Patescibacteria group bacterium]